MTHNIQLDRINTHIFTNRVHILNSTRNFSEDHQSYRNQPAKFRMTQKIVRPPNNKKIKSEALSPQSTRPSHNGLTKPQIESVPIKKNYTFQKDLAQ